MIRFIPARSCRGFGSNSGGEPCPTHRTLPILRPPGGGGYRRLGISGCRGSPFRASGLRARAVPAGGGMMTPRSTLSRSARRIGGARRIHSGSARAMALVLVLLPPAPLQGTPPPRQAPTMGGRPRGRCGFSIISPRRATCGRRRRGWGCRGSRLMCCGGGTGSSGRGGRRRLRWRGGMSRKCWRRGRSMASRSRCSITVSRWRSGGGQEGPLEFKSLDGRPGDGPRAGGAFSVSGPCQPCQPRADTGAWVRGRRRMFGSSGNPAGGTMLL